MFSLACVILSGGGSMPGPMSLQRGNACMVPCPFWGWVCPEREASITEEVIPGGGYTRRGGWVYQGAGIPGGYARGLVYWRAGRYTRGRWVHQNGGGYTKKGGTQSYWNAVLSNY